MGSPNLQSSFLTARTPNQLSISSCHPGYCITLACILALARGLAECDIPGTLNATIGTENVFRGRLSYPR